VPLGPHKRREWKSKGWGTASELRDSKAVRDTLKLAEEVAKRGGFREVLAKGGKSCLVDIEREMRRDQS
jgi:predicted ATPase